MVNRCTASTAEALAYNLMTQDIATVAGEKTAGSMLNAESFHLYDDFYIILPTANYLAHDSFRLDGKGFMPDIEIDPDLKLKNILVPYQKYSCFFWQDILIVEAGLAVKSGPYNLVPARLG